MAAHLFRAWLFTRGPELWNAQWYGGHHVLGYSLAVRAAGRWLGPLLAARSPRPPRPPVRAARAAATGPRRRGDRRPGCSAPPLLSNLAIGRMPFALGIALPRAGRVVALGQRRGAWRRGGGARAGACWPARWPAPSAAGRGRAASPAPPRRRRPRRASLGVPALPAACARAAVPRGRHDRFVASAFWPMLGVSVAGAAAARPARSGCGRRARSTLGDARASSSIPNPFGQQHARLLGTLLGRARWRRSSGAPAPGLLRGCRAAAALPRLAAAVRA